MSEYENDHPEKPSKSQRKRDSTNLQKIGEALIELSESQLDKITLPDDLREAVLFAHTLKSHESIRRHLQFIGKLMRNVDAEPIELAISKIKSDSNISTAKFHRIEKWRDKLITEGDTELQNFIEKYPEADRQQLRQIVRKAQFDRKNNKNTGGETELFRYLRDILS